jgi:YesN/AraC family two-component response regulator
MINAPKLIRILAVDDHALLRKGLAAVINAETDLKLAAEAANGEDAIEKFRASSGRGPDGSSDAWA